MSLPVLVSAFDENFFYHYIMCLCSMKPIVNVASPFFLCFKNLFFFRIHLSDKLFIANGYLGS